MSGAALRFVLFCNEDSAKCEPVTSRAASCPWVVGMPSSGIVDVEIQNLGHLIRPRNGDPARRVAYRVPG